MNKVKNAGGPAASTPDPFCGHCGGESDGSGLQPSESHLHCEGQLALEPPRYCGQCRRRMKVQVTPLGWTAQCSRHGVLVP